MKIQRVVKIAVPLNRRVRSPVMKKLVKKRVRVIMKQLEPMKLDLKKTLLDLVKGLKKRLDLVKDQKKLQDQRNLR